MSDQPTDQPIEIVVDADQPHDHGNHEPADQATMPAMLNLDEAALALGITVNAVRQRIKRGTLIGIKTSNGWLVDVTATDQRPHTSEPTNHPTTPTDQRPTSDLTPLVDHIAALENQVQRLTEASTLWQVRARQAEEKLLELQAGPVVTDDQSDTLQDTPGSPLSYVKEQTRQLPWWRRLWGS